MLTNLVQIKNLSIAVREKGEDKFLVKRVNLTIPSLSIVGLVGGSGSGKTTIGLSILRLLSYGLNITEGQIFYRDQDLLECLDEEIRLYRGKKISMVFQEPLYAFNPVFSIGYQINEVLELHTKIDKLGRQEKIYHLLDVVGINEPKRVAEQFPHQLSGGMRQRAMIAQAIAANPELIIADEPTSNLDVTLQAKIMELFQELREKLKLSVLLISHDLGMISHVCDNVAVMNQGEIVECGKTEEIMNAPRHEYTKQLMRMFKN